MAADSAYAIACAVVVAAALLACILALLRGAPEPEGRISPGQVDIARRIARLR